MNADYVFLIVRILIGLLMDLYEYCPLHRSGVIIICFFTSLFVTKLLTFII